MMMENDMSFTVDIRAADARLICEALRQHGSRLICESKYDGVTPKRRKKMRKTAKRTVALRGLFAPD